MTTMHRPLIAVLAILGSALAQPALEYAKRGAVDGQGNALIQLGDSYSSGEKGEAVLTILPGEADVQKSNYDWRSCQIENTGNKRIAAVYIDVRSAMFPDMVFDDDGSGGDDVAKTLNHDWGTTETNPIAIDQYEWRWEPARDTSFDPTPAFDATRLSNVNNLFVNELSDSGRGCAGGSRGALILFKDFDGGETYEFSADMDPNSIAGLQQGTASIDAEWDVGGVSGAELVGSVVTVLFGDGTTASGTMAPDGSQAGSITVVSNSLGSAPGLRVGSLEQGGSGTYSSSPSVVVTSAPGATVRVTMYRGFDPVDNQSPLAGGKIVAEALVTARLESQYSEFPVNNARELQHVEVQIPSFGFVDVTSMFQFVGQDALGFTAVGIDAVGKWPVSETTSPIRLVYGGSVKTCPSGQKLDGSGYCVDIGCNHDLQCPENSVRMDGRKCYDTFNDCMCLNGFSKSGGRCVNQGNCPDGKKLDGSGYCVGVNCDDDFQCPFGRKPDRYCYNTIDDCLGACPSGKKTDGSGYCVDSSCNHDFQCPFEQKPDRFCYNNMDDCLGSCPSDRPRTDGSGYCVKSWCTKNYSCPTERKADRHCYDTIDDCCPSDRPKLDRSGYCVKKTCNANYKCPNGQKPNRYCYDSQNDCM